jgi:hypothetical protein
LEVEALVGAQLHTYQQLLLLLKMPAMGRSSSLWYPAMGLLLLSLISVGGEF